MTILIPMKPITLICLIMVGTFSGSCDKKYRQSTDAPKKHKNTANRLINEKSPYLQQHAYNPINWYPWGKEAFEQAKKENKPVFLSIGYSTCHWCHVMAHESFENEQIAQLMNEKFIAIKVDREERPDIDNVYMDAARVMGVRGGWPLSVFMTPDKKPFYCGTYFPPESKHGLMGFTTLLTQLSDHWNNDRENIENVSQSVVSSVQHNELKRDSGTIDTAIFKQAFGYFKKNYEPQFGGFSHGNKFPMGHSISFLLRYYTATGDTEALVMATTTLDNMAKGGLFDQIGGGFHRYSTDIYWLVPHFEKMLYDQALLIWTYLEAYQITHHQFYAKIARETIAYVLRDMTHPEGGFYSAEDADSEKKEGKFYLWEKNEIVSLLGPKDGELMCEFYGIDKKGNFEGYSIPTAKYSIHDFAKKRGKKELEIGEIVHKNRKILHAYREKRIRPHRDDKIMTDWNGLMIAALSFASRVLDDSTYEQAAIKAAEYVLKHLQREDGRLMKHRRDDVSTGLGFAEDYSFLVHGLLDLYSATKSIQWLDAAVGIADVFKHFFWDTAKGGYYLIPKDEKDLFTNPKDLYDGAIPSANSFGAYAIVRLAHILQRDEFQKMSKKIFKTFAAQINAFPGGYPMFLIAYDYYVGPQSEIVIAGKGDDKSVKEFLKEVNASFLTRSVILLSEPGSKDSTTALLLPHLSIWTQINNKPTFYFCKNYTCSLPTTQVSEALSKLPNSK